MTLFGSSDPCKDAARGNDSPATAECVNAIARNRGFWWFRVRGLIKARAVALWYALAHNLMRAVALRAEVAIITG